MYQTCGEHHSNEHNTTICPISISIPGWLWSVRLETSLYQVLFNPSGYTMFEPRERTERTEKEICILRGIVPIECITPHAVVVYYYHNGWLRDYWSVSKLMNIS